MSEPLEQTPVSGDKDPAVALQTPPPQHTDKDPLKLSLEFDSMGIEPLKPLELNPTQVKSTQQTLPDGSGLTIGENFFDIGRNIRSVQELSEQETCPLSDSVNLQAEPSQVDASPANKSSKIWKSKGSEKFRLQPKQAGVTQAAGEAANYIFINSSHLEVAEPGKGKARTTLYNSIFTSKRQFEVLRPLQDSLPDVHYSQSHSELKEVRRRGGKFIDSHFNLETNQHQADIVRQYDPYATDWHREGFGWKHLSEIQPQHPPFKIYDDNIHPNDIVQGKLGSCFFLSAISALAERPALIKRIFEGPNLDPSGAQALWLNIAGIWKQIIIDDYYPTSRSSNFAFAQGRGGYLWVPMIEKAYAKAYGSYCAIDGGTGEDALRDLTGAPVEKFDRELKEEQPRLWNMLVEFDKKGYVMVTGKDEDGSGQEIAGQFERKHNNGLISGHEYSLIAAKQVVGSDGRTHRIVQLRNPWGHGEWNGLWSDGSPIWTASLREELNAEAKNDGLFWMPFEDYCREFNDMSVCRFESNFVYNYIKKKVRLDSKTKSYAVAIQIRKSGEYYFSVSQNHYRVYREVSYPFIRIQIVSLDDGSTHNRGAAFKSKKDVSVKTWLSEGTYTALVDVMPYTFPPQQGLERDFTFSSYGCDLAGLELVSLTKKQMALLELYSLVEVGCNEILGWQPRGQPFYVGSVAVNQEVKQIPNWGIHLYKLEAHNQSSYPMKTVLQVSLTPEASCDSLAHDKSFQVETEMPGFFYSKSNDYSITISAAASAGYPNHLGREMLYDAISQVLAAKPQFPVLAQSRLETYKFTAEQTAFCSEEQWKTEEVTSSEFQPKMTYASSFEIRSPIDGHQADYYPVQDQGYAPSQYQADSYGAYQGNSQQAFSYQPYDPSQNQFVYQQSSAFQSTQPGYEAYQSTQPQQPSQYYGDGYNYHQR